MPGLPSWLLQKLKLTLYDCGPFKDDPTLVSVFVDERIAPWERDVPSARNKKERVDLFVAEFLNRRNRAGQNVLVLFLQALHDQTEIEDACNQHLNDVAIEVADALSSNLPPLARNNLWRASAIHMKEALPANVGDYTIPPIEADSAVQSQPLPPGLPASIFAERLESLKAKKADWLPASFLEKGLMSARSVGRVEHHGRKIGTAFLVARDLVLTNAHVVNDIPTLTEGGVRFNVGLQVEPEWRYFTKQIAYSPQNELDFALLRLDRPASGTPLPLSAEGAYRDQPANILQYPRGASLQVALRSNEVVHVDPLRLYYVSDTEEGSSGSPVFDDDWRVIALHRAGVEDAAHRRLKHANQGVPIMAIAPYIRQYLEA
ncbi:MAG TPA: serine protease [Herpetosiphonaceae bacterium]|nr:serine protease [Herpetosiphonaceae bacterium]